MASSAIAAPFKVGKKELYLPNFILTLLRTDNLPPTQARFLVPLWFSKLDLRDYLYHCYGVRTHSITSYVQQQRARFGGAKAKSPMNRKWHRPRAKKFMTVQMDQPFVWPKELEGEELDTWGRSELEMMEKDMDAEQKLRDADSDTKVNEKRREKMREQAKALLAGKEKWKPGTNSRSYGQILTR